jgi:transposase
MPVVAFADCYTLFSTFHQAQAGCAWQLLSPDLPPWRTVHKPFKAWRADGTWDRLRAGLHR